MYIGQRGCGFDCIVAGVVNPDIHIYTIWNVVFNTLAHVTSHFVACSKM